jgi:hypothetical protein
VPNPVPSDEKLTLHTMTTNASNEPVHLTIASETARWQDLGTLLQRGVFCPLAARCSVQEYLTGQLGIDPDYVRDQIATVFVDGSVVDDLETTTLQPGSTLTLSAAMPGLVGATLRKGGFYSAMRSEISWKAGDDEPRRLDGPQDTIRLKLFNTVMRDIGPALLRRGVLVNRQEAVSALGAWCNDVNDAPEGAWVSVEVVAR